MRKRKKKLFIESLEIRRSTSPLLVQTQSTAEAGLSPKDGNVSGATAGELAENQSSRENMINSKNVIERDLLKYAPPENVSLYAVPYPPQTEEYIITTRALGEEGEAPKPIEPKPELLKYAPPDPIVLKYAPPDPEPVYPLYAPPSPSRPEPIDPILVKYAPPDPEPYPVKYAPPDPEPYPVKYAPPDPGVEKYAPPEPIGPILVKYAPPEPIGPILVKYAPPEPKPGLTTQAIGEEGNASKPPVSSRPSTLSLGEEGMSPKPKIPGERPNWFRRFFYLFRKPSKQYNVTTFALGEEGKAAK